MLLAGVVALAARRAGSLATSGAIAATFVGTLAALAGWSWALLLIGWFVASSALTRLGAARKAARSRSSLASSGARNAQQVLANGGLYASLALVGSLSGDLRWQLAALGALAAAAADTWATEIGLLWGGSPRGLLDLRPVAPGMSGGVTAVGLLGSAAGASAVAAFAPLLLDEASARSVVALATAGLLGALVDSALGASLQARRRCEACAVFTERDVHDCGQTTVHARGLRWMTNDTVNLLATLVGALAALALAVP